MNFSMLINVMPIILGTLTFMSREICVIGLPELVKSPISIVLLSSPLVGKRDIVVIILVWCMCVRPPGFFRTITCTIMHGFQNNLAQLLPLKRRSAI